MPLPQRPIERTDSTAWAQLREALRPVALALAFVTAVFVSDHAAARDSASRDVGDWTVTVSKDGKGCFLTREYERSGGTTLLLGLDVDGANRLSVLNANWSIKPEERLKLNFRLSNSSYPAHFAIGIVSEGKQGFVTSFGAKFPSYLAASKTLAISRGDVPVERLDLDDVDAAVARLGKCVDRQRETPSSVASQGIAGRGTVRSDDIPTDPFAPASTRKAKK